MQVILTRTDLGPNGRMVEWSHSRPFRVYRLGRGRLQVQKDARVSAVDLKCWFLKIGNLEPCSC